MSSDLWVEATYDHEAARTAHNLESATYASRGLWAFLAQAQTPEEYADRAALATEAIQTVAAAHDVPTDTLLDVFDHRFALLMEAKDNPFADDSDDGSKSGSDEDDNGDGKPDDSDGGDGADDTDQQTDEDDDGDSDNADNDDKGKSQDPDQDQDEQQGRTQGITPWGSRYAHLAAAIQQGADLLEWSGAAPFVGSPARKHAADGASADTEQNAPEDTEDSASDGDGGTDDGSMTPDTAGDDASMPGSAGSSVPGLDGGIASTTKPRQLPEGGGGIPGMDGDGEDDSLTDQFDPALNGGDIHQGADTTPPGVDDDSDSSKMAKIQPIFSEIFRDNPHLGLRQCYKIAEKVYDTYLVKNAEDSGPLLYGDRGKVPDGPITNAIKNWSPAEAKPPGPHPPPAGRTPRLPEGAGGGAGEAAGAAAGELPAAAGEAAELLPMLVL